jgi:hypothetical protein
MVGSQSSEVQSDSTSFWLSPNPRNPCGTGITTQLLRSRLLVVQWVGTPLKKCSKLKVTQNRSPPPLAGFVLFRNAATFTPQAPQAPACRRIGDNVHCGYSRSTYCRASAVRRPCRSIARASAVSRSVSWRAPARRRRRPACGRECLAFGQLFPSSHAAISAARFAIK